MPIMPHLTDSIPAIDDALRRIKDAGAHRVVYGALHLRPGAKQWFMQWLGREHPELLPSYLGLYPGAATMAPSWRREVAGMAGGYWRMMSPAPSPARPFVPLNASLF